MLADPAEWLEELYHHIQAIDGKHVIAMAYSSIWGDHTGGPCTWPWCKYVNSTDILMPDMGYPVDASPLDNDVSMSLSVPVMTNRIGQAVSNAVDHITRYYQGNKAVWLVAQAFGAVETHPRSPTPGEVRAMAYSALVRGASGVFFFNHADDSRGKTVVHSQSLWVELATADFFCCTPFSL